MCEEVMERIDLAVRRLEQINLELDRPKDQEDRTKLENYFQTEIAFALMMKQTWDWLEDGALDHADVEELAAHNKAMYLEVLPEYYPQSFCNPVYAVLHLGKELGQLLCCAAAEMRAMIPAVFERDAECFVIRLELLLEIYGCITTSVQDGLEPQVEQIRDILYWYFSDYMEPAMEKMIRSQVVPEGNFLATYVKQADIHDERFLYTSGEYVSENERNVARFLMSLPQEEIDRIAKTWAEGYRLGFIATQKELSKKKTVEVVYNLGFERIVQRAIGYFEEMGLSATIRRSPASLLQGKKFQRTRFRGCIPNQQFDYDHREDLGLFLDKNYVNRMSEVLENAFAKVEKEANAHGGPAVLETFGEPDFAPKNRVEDVLYTEAQRKALLGYTAKAGEITNRYIIGEERSFTIIALPYPTVADRKGVKGDYAEIFREIMRINTLDYQLYQRIQQKIIDVLDQGSYVIVKGKDGNRTDMKVMLHPLTDPAHQTNFENCVADVNIPVGEVFTSPVLTGTEGTLHVSGVFLNGLHYQNLRLEFHDGCITSYTCDNYEDEEKNRSFIKETILHMHPTLPIGEFAIGTNTTAYVSAQKLHIADQLPILIAEKMGPHFAVGDTCYSHEEEVKSYNPDGKEIIAKENEKSLLRKDSMTDAYFNCHTDITIPYDELGEISVVRADESIVTIIEDGRFVLEGCEELNRPLDEMSSERAR